MPENPVPNPSMSQAAPSLAAFAENFMKAAGGVDCDAKPTEEQLSGLAVRIFSADFMARAFQRSMGNAARAHSASFSRRGLAARIENSDGNSKSAPRGRGG